MENAHTKVVAVIAFAALACGCSKVPAPAPASQIKVVEATYGLNCTHDIPGVPMRYDITPGNVTSFVAPACDGRASCAYPVDVSVLKDPAQSCPKDFSVSFTCSGSAAPHQVHLDGEANGHTVTLNCGAVPPAGS